MSVVTGIVICHSCSEKYVEHDLGNDTYLVINELNAWLLNHGKSELHSLDNLMCNGKHPQMIVWGGGYNYLNDEEFVTLFRTRQWEQPDQVFMVFNPEDEPMRVIMPTNDSKSEESK